MYSSLYVIKSKTSSRKYKCLEINIYPSLINRNVKSYIYEFSGCRFAIFTVFTFILPPVKPCERGCSLVVYPGICLLLLSFCYCCPSVTIQGRSKVRWLRVFFYCFWLSPFSISSLTKAKYSPPNVTRAAAINISHLSVCLQKRTVGMTEGR